MNQLPYPTWATRVARIVAFGATLTFLPLSPGQSSGNPLTGPTQGFAYDAPSMGLHQVLGSFGSARLGPALVRNLNFGTVAPQHSYGIGCSAEQCSLILGIGSEQIQQTTISDQLGIPEAAVWSADGRIVVLYSRSEQWVRVLRGLPEAAEAGPQWSVWSLGTLSAVAIRPDGGNIVMSITGEHPGVFEITATGNFVPLHEAVNPVALVFSAAGDTLYVLDAGAHTIAEIHMRDGLGQSWPIAAVQDPIGIQLGQDSAGRSVVYVAGRGDRMLFAYDSTSHQLLEQIPLSFAPSQMEPSGSGSFLLTSRTNADELLWSFTAGRGAFFVPVTPAESGLTGETNELPQRKVRR